MANQRRNPFSQAQRGKPRREKAERRDLIRFEPDKEPRRSSKDRRKQNDTWTGRDKV